MLDLKTMLQLLRPSQIKLHSFFGFRLLSPADFPSPDAKTDYLSTSRA